MKTRTPLAKPLKSKLYVLQFKTILSASALEKLQQTLTEGAKGTGVQFIVLDESCHIYKLD